MTEEQFKTVLTISGGSAENLKLGLGLLEERGWGIWFSESSKFEPPDTPEPDHYWLTFTDQLTESVCVDPLNELDRAILLGWLIDGLRRSGRQRRMYWSEAGDTSVALQMMPIGAAFNAERELGATLAAAVASGWHIPGMPPKP